MGELTFIHILREAKKSLDLTLNEYVTADSIYKLSNNPENKKKGWCYASRQYLADNIDVSKRGLIKILDRLVDKKIIEIDKSHHLRTLPIWHKTVIEICEKNDKKGGEQSSPLGVNKVHGGEQSSPVNKVHGGGEQSSPLGVNKVHGGGEQSSPYIYSYSNRDTDTIGIVSATSEKDGNSELSLGSEQSSEIVIPEDIFLSPSTNGVKAGKTPVTRTRKDGKKKKFDSTLEEDKHIGEVIEAFKKGGGNPMLKYTDHWDRLAALEMIREKGIEEVLRVSKYAISIQWDKYAPVITRPRELRNKYGELMVYYKKSAPVEQRVAMGVATSSDIKKEMKERAKAENLKDIMNSIK